MKTRGLFHQTALWNRPQVVKLYYQLDYVYCLEWNKVSLFSHFTTKQWEGKHSERAKRIIQNCQDLKHPTDSLFEAFLQKAFNLIIFDTQKTKKHLLFTTKLKVTDKCRKNGVGLQQIRFPSLSSCLEVQHTENAHLLHKGKYHYTADLFLD